MNSAAVLLAAFLFLGQDPPAKAPTVEDVLHLMESKAEGLKDVSYEVLTGGEAWPMAMGRSLRVAWVRGAGCRIRSSATGTGSGGMEERMAQIFFGGMSDVDFVYSKDAFFCFATSGSGKAAGLAATAQRIAYDDPLFPAFDAFLLPTTIPMRLLLDEPFTYYQIAPRFFFRFEPNLAHLGLRVENGRSIHVLASNRPESDVRKRVLKGMIDFKAPRKEFHIDAETGALLRMQWDFVATTAGGMDREEKVTLVIEGSGSRKLTDKLSVPESVAWTSIEGGGRQSNRMIVHTFQDFKINSGLAPQEILAPSEAADLFADAVLLQKEEYDARLAKNLSDASALYSKALALTQADPEGMMAAVMGGAAPGMKDDKELRATLEKLVELRPAAEGPLVNLFHLAAKSGDPKELIAKIEKENRPLPLLRLAIASWFNDNGKFDEALKHLDAAKPPEGSLRRRTAVERFMALLGRKEDAAAAKGFREESVRCSGTLERIALVREIEARLSSSGKDGTARAAAAFETEPADPAHLLALAWLNTRQFSAKSPASVAALLKAVPSDPGIAEFALEILQGHFDGLADALAEDEDEDEMPPPEAKPAEDAAPIWTREGSAAVAGAVEASAAGKDGLRVSYVVGRLLEAGSDTEGAVKRYEVAFKAASAVKPGEPGASAAGRILFRLALRPGPKKPEVWLEECVEALQKVSPNPSGIHYSLLMSESTNPVLKLAMARVKAKEWTKFYALAAGDDRGYLTPASSFVEALVGQMEACAAACLKPVLAEAKDSGPLKTYARFSRKYLSDEGTDQALARALELSPKDVETMSLLVELAQRRGQHAKAAEALEKMLPHLATPVTTPEGRQSAENVRLRLAQSYSAAGDPAKAKAALEKIDLKASGMDAGTAVSVAELYGTLKETDRAIAAFLRARELGAKPNFPLGRLYEAKEDWYEALRWYNRDIAEGSRAGEGAAQPAQFEVEMDEDDEEPAPGKKPDESEPKNGKEGRDRLLAKVGEDFFINRHLGQKFEALGAEEAKSVKGAIEKLGSHDLADRDAATAAIRKAGPRASPLLAEPSKSADPEIRGRARKLLMEWAEPK